MKYKVSVSKLDTFNKYINETKNKFGTIIVPENIMIDNIIGLYTPNLKADYGTVFHEILEKPAKYFNKKDETYNANFHFLIDILGNKRVQKISQEEFNNNIERAKNIVNGQKVISSLPLWKYDKDAIIQYLECENPKYISSEIPINDFILNDVRITMRIDGFDGTEIKEYKTMYGENYNGIFGNWTINFDKSMYDLWKKSYQWRLYLLAMDSVHFVQYYIFQFGIENDIDANHNNYTKLNLYQMKKPKFERYDNMENDCINLVNEFIDFCKLHNLEKYIEDKKRK